MSFHPYLNFPGTCREAFTAYEAIFGGELYVMGMGDVPGGEAGALPPEMADRTIHAALTLPDGSVLMASDTQDDATFEAPQSMWVNYATADADDAKRVFDALAEGGRVDMPFGPTFFSSGYGICVDRFGTPWMVSTSPS
jgi:PhnB protein